jgi:hypothetical protein
MATLTATALVATFAAGLVLASTASRAEGTPGMTGDERFEASLQQSLDEANTQVVSQLEKDPAAARLTTEPNPVAQEATPPEAISVGTISGVPGDPKFEAEFAAWLRQVDEGLKDELSNDPTGLNRVH